MEKVISLPILLHLATKSTMSKYAIIYNICTFSIIQFYAQCHNNCFLKVPIVEYNFNVSNLLEDVRDGVRLCRVVQLLKCDTSVFSVSVYIFIIFLYLYVVVSSSQKEPSCLL